MLIDFTHPDQNVVKYFPPLPAKKAFPEWYKKLPKEYDDQLPEYMDRYKMSIKDCVPVRDMISAGYIIRAPFETQFIAVQDDEIQGFKYMSAQPGGVAVHKHSQCPMHINNTRNDYFKLKTDWEIKTPPGYSCLLIHPFYNFESRFEFLPGIIDTDRFQGSMNVIGMLKTKERVDFNPGDPLIQVIPFKRDEWQSTISVKQPSKTIFQLFLDYKLSKIYKKFFHSKKRFD